MNMLLVLAYLCSAPHFVNIFTPFDFSISESRREYEHLVALPGYMYPKPNMELIGNQHVSSSGSSSSCNGTRCYMDVDISVDDPANKQSIQYTWNNIGMLSVKKYKYRFVSYYRR